MINLVLLRHGQSYTNSGKSVDYERQNLLTTKGIQDTIKHTTTLRQVLPKLHFDIVFTSPLSRAQQTTYNFLSTFDNKAVDIIADCRLRERDYGFITYRPLDELVDSYGQEVVDSWDYDLNGKPSPDGESLYEVYQRTNELYSELVLPRILSGEKVLIVSHYYVMKCLQSFIQFGNINMVPVFEPKNSIPVPFNIPLARKVE